MRGNLTELTAVRIHCAKSVCANKALHQALRVVEAAFEARCCGAWPMVVMPRRRGAPALTRPFGCITKTVMLGKLPQRGDGGRAGRTPLVAATMVALLAARWRGRGANRAPQYLQRDIL